MRRRTGFTLVEVLVSMALILFIMSILAAAFAAATQTVSDLKSAGDLAEKLRGATSVLRRDLAGSHFTPDGSVSTDKVLSTLWAGVNPTPPQNGSFRIFQAQADQAEPIGGAVNDLDGIPSFYQTTAALHFTTATGNIGEPQRSDFFSAFVPGNSPLLTASVLSPADARYQDSSSVYNSPVAEVAVFLVATGDSTDPVNGTSFPLFALYRRQMTTIPPGLNPTTPAYISNAQLQAPASSAVDSSGNNLYLETSTNIKNPDSQGNLYFNGPDDLTMPFRRLGMDPSSMAGTFPSGSSNYPRMVDENTNGQPNTNFKSADLLLTDVVSFDVRVLLQGGPDFVDLFDPSVQLFSNNNPAFTAPAGPRVFDTWSNQGPYATTWNQPNAATSIPLFQNNKGQAIAIQAIQITLRVWDFKTKKTRQVTMVQKM